MDKMPSGEFRRRYATLNHDVLVTANGHVIGEWRPYGPRRGRSTDQIAVPFEAVPKLIEDRFNSRGSRPVPKK